MFTGIVEELGTVDRREGGRFTFGASTVLEDLKIGDSVAETMQRTNLDDLGPGDSVNFERPVRLADRLGGHLVQGHVDAVGEIIQPVPDLHIRMPGELARY